MTEDDIFKQTNGAYLDLIRPVLEGSEYSHDIASVIALAPSVPAEIVTTMLAGPSWRERLLGLCMAMTKQTQPASFIESMLQSLRDPRCLAIVPTSAALALLARRRAFTMTLSFEEMFDLTLFSGEVGWAVHKAMHFSGLCSDDVSGCAPNDGQSFEDHIRFYDSIRAA